MTEHPTDNRSFRHLERGLSADEFVTHHPTIDDPTTLSKLLSDLADDGLTQEMSTQLGIAYWKCPYCSSTKDTLGYCRHHITKTENTPHPPDTDPQRLDPIIGFTSDNIVTAVANQQPQSNGGRTSPAIEPPPSMSTDRQAVAYVPPELLAGSPGSRGALAPDSVPDFVDHVQYWFCPICGFNLPAQTSGDRYPLADVYRHIILSRDGHADIQNIADDVYVVGTDAAGDIQCVASIESSTIVYSQVEEISTPYDLHIPDHWVLKLTHEEVDPIEKGVEYWACPFCDEIDSNPGGQFIRNHITGRYDEAHDGESGFNPDEPIFGYNADHDAVVQMSPARADVKSDKSVILEVWEGEGRPPTPGHKQRYHTKPAEPKAVKKKERVYTAWQAANALEKDLVPVFGSAAEFSATDIQSITGVEDLALVERIRFETDILPDAAHESLVDVELLSNYRNDLRAMVRERQYGEGGSESTTPEFTGDSAVVSQILEELGADGDVFEIGGIPVRFLGEFDEGLQADGEEILETKDPLDRVRGDVERVVESIQSQDAGGLDPEGISEREGILQMADYVLRIIDTYGESADRNTGDS